MNLEDYDKGAARLQEAISQMGYPSLRPGQASPIDCIMYGRDTICILPTGAGKTALFALPTIAMEWKTIVFSPLIALMRDQVQNMNRAGIRTGCINSNQTEMQNYSILKEWADGVLQMLYVAPERLTNPQFKQAMVALRPDFVVLDECIHPETEVKTLHHSKKALLLEEGDSILSFDEYNNVTEDTVTRVCYKGIRPTFSLVTRSGKRLVCTANEKIYTPGGWIYLADLFNDDQRLAELTLRSICKRAKQRSEHDSGNSAWRLQYTADKRLCECKGELQSWMETGRTSIGKNCAPSTMDKSASTLDKESRTRHLPGKDQYENCADISPVLSTMCEERQEVCLTGVGGYVDMGVNSLVVDGRRESGNRAHVPTPHTIVFQGGSGTADTVVSRTRNTGCEVSGNEGEDPWENVRYNYDRSERELYNSADDSPLHAAVHDVQSEHSSPGVPRDMHLLQESICTRQTYEDSLAEIRHLRLLEPRMPVQACSDKEAQLGDITKVFVACNGQLVEDEIQEISFNGFQPVMDIETEKNHTFFAGDIAVHNCHTLSEWSDNFRPAYQRCGEFIEEYNPKVVAAFTATATNQVIADVERVLKITDACICRYYPPRENLHLSSEVLTTNDDLYPSILKQVRRVKGSCIVYCQTVKEVSKLTEYLSQSGESVTFYHGQIQETNLKDMNQDEFMSGRARICVATNAFGMGIDKPDIEGVIHAGPPGSVEAVTQETGRAARDGRDAVCHMFMTPSGRWMQEFFWNTSNPDGHTVRDVYNYLKRISGTDGVAYITGKDLCEAVESPSAEGALNYLQACGCVERFDSGIKLYTITLKSPDPESIKATHKKVYDLVQEGGTAAGVSDEGYPVYQIDMAWLVSKLSVLASTVQAKINQLKKDGHIDFIPPFRGKATRLISPPTQEDIDRADQKRSVEWKKIADVREYVETPDDEKQDFLQNYFMIDRNAIS